ncbi:OmpA family protein [Vulgatibacter incomptus]|uniref:OmpA domain protein n=1 Tax=Vulgatibacter incomptus TaxID=1391653 RepID=A0A0K1P9Q8_9BACT|nr:OmpA family protein [Vulgatibacter incomptus]AKU90232.1 OmpA domain protein [Vulgatibacter incomptus]
MLDACAGKSRGSNHRRGASAAALALCLTAALPSHAGAAGDPFARGIDPIGAKLGATMDGFLTVEGGRTAPAGSFQLQLAADFASGLLALRQGDEKVGDLIERRLDLHLLGSWAVADWAELGIDLPVTAWQSNGFDLLEEKTGFPDQRPGGSGAGDVRLLGKIRLLSEERAPVGVAVVAEARLPTGDRKSFLGENGFFLSPRAVIERSFGDSFRLGFEGGYRYRQDAGQYMNLYVGDELTFALAGSYRLPDAWSDLTAYAELLTATPSRAPFTSASADALKTPIEALLGMKAELGNGFHALAGGGTGIAGESGFGRESFRLFASIGYRSIAAPRIDREIDSDGDGIPDHLDRCPNEPGPAELDGCPDTDGDGIPDIEDKCPTVPGLAIHDGCPAEYPLATFENGKIELKAEINFDTGRADIKKDSFEVLDVVASLLRDHPEIKKVRIDGHTDSQGSAQLNHGLSRRRAASVVDYLVGKGITRERVSSAGYGPDRPIASNSTPLGRAKNRRVEFTIVDSDAK